MYDQTNNLKFYFIYLWNWRLLKCIRTQTHTSLYKFEPILSISEPPRNISILGISKDSIVYGIVDKQMTLTCDVESGKPPELMQWMNRNAVVATGGPASLTYTFIPNVSNHLQSLRCIAFNNVTRITLTKRVTLHLYCEYCESIYRQKHSSFWGFFLSGKVNLYKQMWC